MVCLSEPVYRNLTPLGTYEYFKYLLEELPKHVEFEDLSYIDDLLP